MIEELQILREIFGDLSAVGIWAIVAYFGYKVLVIIGWLCAMLIGLHAIKYVYKSIVEQNERDSSEIRDARCDRDNANRRAEELRAEVERVKHMYKLLKEAK